MAKDRNEKEMEVFNFIKSRLSEGISPSVREIMDAVGFGSIPEEIPGRYR